MDKLSVLLITISIHHNNTQKVAEAMADVLDADIKTPSEVSPEDIESYDCIGFGSGIYDGKHHKSIFSLIEKLPQQKEKSAFIFSTATIIYMKMHKDLKNALTEKGFTIVDEYMGKGFINYSITKYFFGGLNKGRPNENDLEKAKEFAQNLLEKV